MWFDWDGELIRCTHTKVRQKFRNLVGEPRIGAEEWLETVGDEVGDARSACGSGDGLGARRCVPEELFGGPR
jgi:hypothetical protein